MSLSDNLICLKHPYKKCTWAYPEENVKEFIKRVKTRIIEWDWQSIKALEIINEEAGEKLIEQGDEKW